MESPDFDSHFRDAPSDLLALAHDLRDQGYAVVDFPDPEIDAICERLISRFKDHFHHNTRLTNVWEKDWSWNPGGRDALQLAVNPRIIEILTAIFGRQAFPFQTLNFRSGSQQRAHSDTVHFASDPSHFVCGVWVALEDVGPESGPLFYYPESHRLPILSADELGLASPPSEAGYPKFEEGWDAIVEAEGLKKEPFLAKRGQAVIWLANLLHGGEPVIDPGSTRYSQVTHYFFEGCRYWTPIESDPARGVISERLPKDLRDVQWEQTEL